MCRCQGIFRILYLWANRRRGGEGGVGRCSLPLGNTADRRSRCYTPLGSARSGRKGSRCKPEAPAMDGGRRMYTGRGLGVLHFSRQSVQRVLVNSRVALQAGGPCS